MQSKYSDYDKGYTRAVDAGKTELLLRFHSGDIQRIDGRRYRHYAKLVRARRPKQRGRSIE